MSPTCDTAEPRLLVSIVVPNLNGASFLPMTLASLGAQTYPEIEVVVVDGGSTDGSLDIIRHWADRLPMRWISEPDSGQAQAINKGFRMANGEVLGWINSDDLLTARSVEYAVERFAADPELGFVWGFCLVVDADERPVTIQNPYVRPDLGQLRSYRNYVSQPGSWYRRRVVEAFGPLSEELHFLFDYDFFLRRRRPGEGGVHPRGHGVVPAARELEVWQPGTGVSRRRAARVPRERRPLAVTVLDGLLAV